MLPHCQKFIWHLIIIGEEAEVVLNIEDVVEAGETTLGTETLIITVPTRVHPTTTGGELLEGIKMVPKGPPAINVVCPITGQTPAGPQNTSWRHTYI